MKRRHAIGPLFCLRFLLIVCSALVCLKPAFGGEKPLYGGVYRVPLRNNPPSLDPAYAQDIHATTVIQQLFDGLVQFSPELFVTPALAKNWAVEEKGKTYRFFLREDAKFHNGTPVTAADVVFSLSRLLRVTPSLTILPHLSRISGAREYLEGRSDRVSGIEVIDEHTLVVRLEQPYAPFLVALGMYQAKIVPKEIVEKDQSRFGREPVGSGPFLFVSWEPDKIIKLKNFADYFGGRPFLDAIEFLIYPGAESDKTWADFESGKLEQMPVYGDIREKAKNKKGIVFAHRPSLSLLFYGFNCRNEWMQNADLRAALSLAIDRAKLVEAVYGGQFEAANGILPPGLPGHRPNSHQTLYDLEKARQHLLKAVGKDLSQLGEIEVVSNSQSPFAQAELELLGKAWEQLGVKMKAKFITDWSQYKAYLNSSAMQVYRMAWYADMPDPDDMLRPLFASSSPSNYMKYRDETIDRMLQEGLEIADPLQRAGFYQQLEDSVLAAHPLAPLLYLSNDFAYQDYVQGVQLSALGVTNLSFHSVWLNKP